MFPRFCTIVAALALTLPLATAQTGKEEIKSKAALDALDAYGKAYQTINKEFKLRHQDLLKTLIADLNPARADAIGAGDLDEAMAILLKVKEAEKLHEQDQVVAVKVPEKPGRFEIVSAYWGAQESWIEVTKEVKGLVKLNRLVMEQPEKAGFRDPKFGTVKNLLVVYIVDGQTKSAIYNYNQRVVLPK